MPLPPAGFVCTRAIMIFAFLGSDNAWDGARAETS